MADKIEFGFFKMSMILKLSITTHPLIISEYPDAISEVMDLKQTGTVQSYYEELEGFCNLLQLIEKDALLIFINKLKPEISKAVSLFYPKTLTYALEVAKQVELKLAAEFNYPEIEKTEIEEAKVEAEIENVEMDETEVETEIGAQDTMELETEDFMMQYQAPIDPKPENVVVEVQDELTKPVQMGKLQVGWDGDIFNSLVQQIDADQIYDHEIGYIVLKEADIKQRQKNDVSKVSNVLSKSRVDATILLCHYNWSVSKVHEEWFADEGVRQFIGLSERPVVRVSNARELSCGICFESLLHNNISSAACGHFFCRACWQGYICKTINDGPRCLSLRCPDPSCNAIDFAFGSGNFDVFRFYSHTFCWNCTEEAHRPSDCNTMAKWILKNSVESENMNWILANSKPCKFQGCMNMQCTPPCKFEFCWLCLGALSVDKLVDVNDPCCFRLLVMGKRNHCILEQVLVEKNMDLMEWSHLVKLLRQYKDSSCYAVTSVIRRSIDAAIHYEAVGVTGNRVHSSSNIKKVVAAGALQTVISLLTFCCSDSQREAAVLLGQIVATDSDCKVHITQLGAERIRNVMILMSDTGSGHRVLVEAIRDAFRIEFGDKYTICVKDVWKEYAGWPLKNMKGSYKFMVKHVQLRQVIFHSTSIRWIHSNYLAAIVVYDAKEVAKRALYNGFEEFPIQVFCLPIWRSFARAVFCKDDLRKEMDPDLLVVLLMGVCNCIITKAGYITKVDLQIVIFEDKDVLKRAVVVTGQNYKRRKVEEKKLFSIRIVSFIV